MVFLIGICYTDMFLLKHNQLEFISIDCSDSKGGGQGFKNMIVKI